MLRRRLNRSRARARRKLNGNIDMTPILDMTFLLLIAFIITFPALQNGVSVRLPTASGDPLPAVEPLAVTIRADGAVFLDGEPVDEAALAERVRARLAADPNAAAHIRGDEAQSYGKIMEVIRVLRHAGLSKFSLVTESE